VDPASRLCAMNLAGCTPHEVLQHESLELARDRAEGIRVAYVAATRARDLLVVPAVGDELYDADNDKWVSSLNQGLYPALERRRTSLPAPGCPAFRSSDSVLSRPDGDPASPATVAPGLHAIAVSSKDGIHEEESADGMTTLDARRDYDGGFEVVWWDPSILDLDREPRLGLRQTELIGKDTSPDVVSADLATYRQWEDEHAARIGTGSRPTFRIARASEAGAEVAGLPGPEDVQVMEADRAQGRPSGPRFGSLVHGALASVPLDAEGQLVDQVVEAQARLVGATEAERRAASVVVRAALSHDLLRRARRAEERGACRRETPVCVVGADGTLVEGQVDLAFEEDDAWTVVDFKTDAAPGQELQAYRRQVAVYTRALAVATGRPARGVLLRL
jgi:ATP-dependent exoDNAse (exonuclease V) beta subunit